MVGRLLALFAVLATVIAAASVPLLRAGQCEWSVVHTSLSVLTSDTTLDILSVL